MRILFLSHYFPPEVNAPAVRTFEHTREWVRMGHEVHVVTGVPSHPRGRPFPGYRRCWYQNEEVEGIHVHRVWTFLAPNAGTVRRSLNYLSFVPTTVWRAVRLGRADVIVATSPQFFCAVAGWLAGFLKRTPWIFELRDLWPESIAAVGAVRRGLVVRMLERLELHLYRSARAVVCVTRSFIANLTRRGIDPGKLEFVPNGVDLDFWARGDRARGRRSLGAADDDVIASYVGTVGMAHGIGTVVEAAKLLKASRPNVRLIVVGDGAERDGLVRQAVSLGLDNLTFLGLVEHARTPDLLAATDISLVLLKRSSLFLTVLPSKLFEAMGAGRPVVLGVGGEARQVLETSGAGIAIEPEDTETLAAAVAKLAADAEMRAAMGHAGQVYVAREFDRRQWAERYMACLVRLVGVEPA